MWEFLFVSDNKTMKLKEKEVSSKISDFIYDVIFPSVSLFQQLIDNIFWKDGALWCELSRTRFLFQ